MPLIILSLVSIKDMPLLLLMSKDMMDEGNGLIIPTINSILDNTQASIIEPN